MKRSRLVVDVASPFLHPPTHVVPRTHQSASTVGVFVGVFVGAFDGRFVGRFVGSFVVGEPVGAFDGASVACLVQLTRGGGPEPSTVSHRDLSLAAQ